VEVGERLGESRKSACERKKEMETVASEKGCFYNDGLLDSFKVSNKLFHVCERMCAV